MSVEQRPWEAAVHHLYEDACDPYAATGPRSHQDWTFDVLTLMARTPDPRGWAVIDGNATQPYDAWHPPHPFAVHPPEYIAQRLYQIDRDSAENLLLALTDSGCTLGNLARFTESEEELRAMARTILARYGDEATYHTNVSSPGHEPGTLDFTMSDSYCWAYNPLSVYVEDYGLIVVTDAEVGVFWHFADI